MASLQDRRESWKRIIALQQSSGQNGRTWCEANGVALASFYQWRKKIGGDGAPGPNSVDIQWLAVQPVAAPSVSTVSSGITLHVGGIRVDVATGFDRHALSDVISVLNLLTQQAVEGHQPRC